MQRKRPKKLRYRKGRKREGQFRRHNLHVTGIPETHDKANEAEATTKELIEENSLELKN